MGVIVGATAILAVCGIGSGAQQAGTPNSGAGNGNGAANGNAAGQNQPGGPVKTADTKVNVSVEEARLTDVVKTLMTQIGANYTIDPVLRGSIVTAHLTGVKFSVALDVVMRGATVPAEVTLEDGIYRVRVRQEPEAAVVEAAPGEAESGPTPKHAIDHAFVSFIDAGLLAQILSGAAFSMTGETFGFVPYANLGANLNLNPPGNAGNSGAGTANGANAPTGASSFYTGGGGVLIFNRGERRE